MKFFDKVLQYPLFHRIKVPTYVQLLNVSINLTNAKITIENLSNAFNRRFVKIIDYGINRCS